MRALGWLVMLGLVCGLGVKGEEPKMDGGGFLFVTFKGEQTPMSEQVYFGVSLDGRRWEALNKGEAVLVSGVGEKGVRDPYLLRLEGGKGFVIVGTDLSIHRNGDWKRATHAGSRSIVIWESGDLVTWSGPRLVEVGPEDAGCVWAPEVIWEEERQDYLVYWASTTGRDGFQKQRIWSVRTSDFKVFTKAEIYIEKPGTVIDTDIVREGGWGGRGGRYYRFTKDEKFKAITMEVAERVSGPWKDVEGFSLGKLVGYEGPAAFEVTPGGDGKPGRWCLLLDHYSKGEGYKAFVTTDLSSGKFEADAEMVFPFRFRHGSVLKLSAAEMERVRGAYGK